jgi:AcrR family transcriptional regulator
MGETAVRASLRRPQTAAMHASPTAPMQARPRTARADSRVALVLDAAAAQFAAMGYQAASIRDIVGAVGMLSGSLYCHFTCKKELLAEVYAEGVRRIGDAVRDAAGRHTDPWDRRDAACTAHLWSPSWCRADGGQSPRQRAQRIEAKVRNEQGHEEPLRARTDPSAHQPLLGP